MTTNPNPTKQLLRLTRMSDRATPQLRRQISRALQTEPAIPAALIILALQEVAAVVRDDSAELQTVVFNEMVYVQPFRVCLVRNFDGLPYPKKTPTTSMYMYACHIQYIDPMLPKRYLKV